MAQRKDMRRDDLIVPYAPPKNEKEDVDMQSTMASTLPMAAIFTRNKLIGWTSVLFAIQAWLSETPASKASSTTPAIMSFGMAMMGVGVAYLPLFLPPAAGGVGQATPAGAAAPQAA
ncbi:hypothetical protein LTR95_002015 [Oleoguttula sp. CCFEE 5521]